MTKVCWLCRNAYPEVARTARVLAGTLKRMGPEQAVNIDAAVQVRNSDQTFKPCWAAYCWSAVSSRVLLSLNI